MIQANTNSFGEVSIILIGKQTEGYCFDSWVYQNNYDSVLVKFYINESMHEVLIEFNDYEDNYEIKIEDYIYS